jgi:ankyrin repeat protein
VVRWLVETGGADVNATNGKGSTALMWAASKGHVDVVRWLVEAGGADVAVFTTTDDGVNTLMWAASEGHVDVVRWLVETGGADVNATNGKGSTALMWAASKGHVDVVRWLVERGGADVSAEDAEGMSAFLLAARDGKTDVIRCLRPWVSKDTATVAFMWAGSRGHVAAAQWLLGEEGGATADEVTDDGYTTLLLAAEGGHTDVLRMLLLHGEADASAQNDYGETIWDLLDQAVGLSNLANRYPGLFKLLLARTEPPPRLQSLPLAQQGRTVRERLPEDSSWRSTHETTLQASHNLPSSLSDLVNVYARPSEDDLWEIASAEHKG